MFMDGLRFKQSTLRLQVVSPLAPAVQCSSRVRFSCLGYFSSVPDNFNFSQNGPAPGQGITIGMYFNPTLSPATSRALIQSNSNLIRNAGGIQGVKMGAFFGVVNAFQWYANSWK
jgi:hypothetical protein